MGISTLFFLAVTASAGLVFARKVRRIRSTINLGQPLDRNDQPGQRWATMARVALGQGKMGARPWAAALHILVYVGFVLINIEVVEMVVDGILGTHRFFKPYLGGLYDFSMSVFEVLAALVLLACVAFIVRRVAMPLPRLQHPDLAGFPQKDAHTILVTEIVLMAALLTMNAAEAALPGGTSYVLSGMFVGLFSSASESTLHAVATGAWWFHWLGILAFLNYLPYSKHFHIVLAFPNTFYSKLTPKGQLDNMASVTQEVKAMLDPSFVPDTPAEPGRFGAKDITDLHWVNLLNAYTCTECGRCTDECPANKTGKKLSPRRIMMATRDRMETYRPDDGLSLLDHGISREELWACTTCNACTEACPIGIDPLDIIVQMRRYIVMEESGAPHGLNAMMTNLENNGAPWPFAQADKAQWASEMNA
jgi:ferredoxin